MTTASMKFDAPAAAASAKRLKILCVDDEPHVLEGLALHLRRRYDVVRAASGAAGLEIVQRDRAIAVVISDMRMPGMDGAAFLTRSRQFAPDAVRILLTGQSQFESAVAAVNEGRIFRLLTKPCQPATLLATIESAAEQHRLVTSERVLLEQTLHGCIKALTDVLALTSPLLFGRASRTKHRASQIAKQLGIGDRWQIEVAAMLSQLGSIALPDETVEKLCAGESLVESERQMVARVPAVAEQLLSGIPRIEVIRGILFTYGNPCMTPPGTVTDAERDAIVKGAHILRAAIDFDVLLEEQGDKGLAIDMLRSRPDRYNAGVLDALMATLSVIDPRLENRTVDLAALEPGMVLAKDVRLTTGALLAARGYEITPGFIMRAANFKESVRQPIDVIVDQRRR